MLIVLESKSSAKFSETKFTECINTDKKYTYISSYYSPLLAKYCSAIWDPYHLSDINKLKMIQHYAARFVLNRQQQNDRLSTTVMLANLK